MKTTNLFKTELLKQHASHHARVTKITTGHGEILTPAFMPVGTRAVVNHLLPHDLWACGSQIILGGNTYHMLVEPGLDVIRKACGMHQFMNWHGPMLTDSGGFQVFSLSKNSGICTIDEEGAHFKHPQTGVMIHLTPQTSIQTQKIIGADIIMAFDQCTPDVVDKNVAIHAMERTHRWLLQSKQWHEKNSHSAYGYPQALFGIVQGSYFRDLREKSADYVLSMDLDGIAIGGEVIGFDMAKTCEILRWVIPMLPQNKTRYAMGVGLHPQNLIDVVAEGIDIFDCVAPTRNARHGSLYCGKIIKEHNWVRFEDESQDGKISIKKAIYADDERPIMAQCTCVTCKHYSRAYLHYLFKEDAISYTNLACIHNVHVMHEVCRAMRECIF